MTVVRVFSTFLLAAAASLPFNALAQSAAPVPVPATTADNTVLMRGPAGDVTLGQVRAAVEVLAPPQLREDFFANPRNIEQMALTVYIRQALAAQAKKEGFDRQPDVAQAMAIGQLQALTDSWLTRQAKKQEPGTAQLEKYARSAYDAQPAKGIDGKPLDFESQRTELMAQARAKLANQARVEIWNAAQAGAQPDTDAIAAQVQQPAQK